MVNIDKKKIAKSRALRRASHRCLVIKQCAKTLDELEKETIYDTVHAIDVLIASLAIPESDATVELLKRLLEYDN